MRKHDWIRWVARAMVASPLRSTLTAIGIGIGIFAVVLLTAIGEGMRLYILDSFTQFGTRIIAVTPGKITTQGLAGLLSTVKPLTLADAEALGRLPQVTYMTPVVSGTGSIKSAQRARNTEILGVGSEAAAAWRFRVAAGRFLPPDPRGGSRAFAVLGDKLARELFGSASPLGQLVRVGGYRFRVVGVMAPKGQFLGFDLDDVIYIPAERALQLFNREGVMEIDLVYSPATRTEILSEQVRRLLVARHGREDFTRFTQDDMLATLDRILSVVKMTIAALGSISLFVGAVGVLTIMTTALHERRQEIGLLRALGTTRGQLLGLFLGEAMVLSIAGGLLGLTLAALLVAAVQVSAVGLPVTLHPVYALLSLLLAAGIGLLAGIWPAVRACSLDPVKALQGE